MRLNSKKILDKLNKKAKSYYGDPEKLVNLLKSAKLKLTDNNQLADMVEDVGVSINLVKDFSKKRYTNISKSTIITIIAGLIYLVNPLDLIPDFLFGGFVDDAAVIAYILNSIRGELDNYKQWKA